MLRTETVERTTLELLKTLMRDEKLSDFTLVGGTNLALQIGHRMSIDIDMFTNKPFETAELVDYLIERYNMQIEIAKPKNTIIGRIADVKVDLIAHIYPLLEDLIIDEEVRLCSLIDIACMKLVAISDTGTRLKDFVDIAYLSTKMSFSQMIKGYTKKYPNTSPMRAIKGLAYHEDINLDDPIELCSGKKFEWKKIEQRIRDMIKFETKVFENAPAQDLTKN